MDSVISGRIEFTKVTGRQQNSPAWSDHDHRDAILWPHCDAVTLSSGPSQLRLRLESNGNSRLAAMPAAVGSPARAGSCNLLRCPWSGSPPCRPRSVSRSGCLPAADSAKP